MCSGYIESPTAIQLAIDRKKESIIVQGTGSPTEQQQFDNEWIKFMSNLAKNESAKDVVDYIDSLVWTTRQKKTIMAYAKVMMGRGLSTTFFTGYTDYRMLYDDKALVDCDLPLGMTRFDVTPEFNLLIGMINLHFGIESRRSKGGFFTKRIGAQRQEIIHEEHTREKMGFADRIKNKFGMGSEY